MLYYAALVACCVALPLNIYGLVTARTVDKANWAGFKMVVTIVLLALVIATRNHG